MKNTRIPADEALSKKIYALLPIGTVFTGNLNPTRKELFAYKKLNEQIFVSACNHWSGKSCISSAHNLFIMIVSNSYTRCSLTLPSSKSIFINKRLEKLSYNLSKRKT